MNNKATIEAAAKLFPSPDSFESMMAVTGVEKRHFAKNQEGDWIKGQVMAIETGILSFEGAFLGQILLPSGQTILEHATANKLLPAPDTKEGA